MADTLRRLSDRIDRLAELTGRAVTWCALAMVLVQFAVILLRYVFGLGSLWLQESLAYFHAALILFAAAWTLRAGGHVRVDVFYAEAGPRARAWIDLIGALLMLLPFMVALMWLSWPYARRAWIILEGSRESSGLPLVFLLKSMIPLFAAQFFLQGLSQAIRAGLMLSATAPRDAATS
ncbi:MAG: TRAP transporter small permease subunit [Xanthobacteraceae bacterium]|nr:MAG: TRAP transporter small permease subunit [Xanthobacteraceae bacterium]